MGQGVALYSGNELSLSAGAAVKLEAATIDFDSIVQIGDYAMTLDGAHMDQLTMLDSCLASTQFTADHVHLHGLVLLLCAAGSVQLDGAAIQVLDCSELTGTSDCLVVFR